MASLLSLSPSSLKRWREQTTKEALPVVKKTPPKFCQKHQLKYLYVAQLVPNKPITVHARSGYLVSHAS